MKYLVYIRPSDELTDSILRYRKSISRYISWTSKNGPYITLMAIYASRRNERAIVQSLEDLSWQEFYIKTEDLELFEVGKAKVLALKIKRNPVLTALHLKVINALKDKIKWEETPDFTEDESRSKVYAKYGSPYYAEFYNPHISVGQVRPEIISDVRFDASQFRSSRWTASEFYLSKNSSHKWELITRFLAKKTT